MHDYAVRASTLWIRFVDEIRFALLVIGLVWLFALLFRPRKEWVAAAGMLFVGAIILVHSGCGAQENGVIMPNSRSADAVAESTAEFEGDAMQKMAPMPMDEAGSAPALSRPEDCLLYTSPSPRDQRGSRMPSSA